MPTFRNYTANTASGIPSGQRASGEAFGANVGAAMQDFGQAGVRAATEVQESWIRTDLVEQHKQLALAREEATKQLDEWRQEGRPVNARMQQWLDDKLAGLESSAETKPGRDLIARMGSVMRSDMLQVSRDYDAKIVGQQVSDTAKLIKQQAGVWLQQYPDTLPLKLDEIRAFADTAEIPEYLRESVYRDMAADATENAVRGWAVINPEAAKQKLEAGAFDENITPDVRDRMLGEIDRALSRKEQAAAASRAEVERKYKIASDYRMNELLAGAHGNTLKYEDILAASLETHPDNSPVLSPDRVNSLYNIVDRMKVEGAVPTDPNALRSLMVEMRAGTLTPDLVDSYFEQGLLSQPDYKTFNAAVTEGPAGLRTVRSQAFGSIASYMGVMPMAAQFLPDFGKASTEIVSQAIEQEGRYTQAGKDPMSYYTDGSYERDAKAIGSKYNFTGQVSSVGYSMQNLTPGDVIELGGRKLKFTGGDPYAQDADGNFLNFEFAD